MVILHITEILPAPLPGKRDENDILLKTISEYKKNYPDSKHIVLFTIPFVSRLGSFLFPRKKPYYLLRKQGSYIIKGFEIGVIGIYSSGYRIRLLRSFLDQLSWLKNKRRLSSIIEKENITLIHAHNVYHTASISRNISALHHIPYLVTTRNIHQFHRSRNVQKNLLKASALISLNHNHQQLAETITNHSHSFLLPHGIDEAFLQCSSIRHKNQRDDLHIISICRLISLKNIHLVLEALSMLKINFKYDVYGEGPEKARLEKMAKHFNIDQAVTFHGQADHSLIPKILGNYDVFVLPSYPETLGRVYFEAMAVGLPVVAAIGSGIEGYIQNGQSGFLTDPHASKKLAEILQHIHKYPDQAKAIGMQGARIAINFSWQQCIDQLNRIYRIAMNDVYS